MPAHHHVSSEVSSFAELSVLGSQGIALRCLHLPLALPRAHVPERNDALGPTPSLDPKSSSDEEPTTSRGRAAVDNYGSKHV